MNLFSYIDFSPTFYNFCVTRNLKGKRAYFTFLNIEVKWRWLNYNKSFFVNKKRKYVAK